MYNKPRGDYMFKTLDKDRSTIERKYHIPGEDFNSFLRWNYHGYDYDESTGLSDKEIDEGLLRLSKELEGKPRPIYKAKLFEYVLDNTRIDVSESDYFIGFYTWARPISKYCVYKWEDELCSSLPDANKVLKEYSEAGMAYGGLDFDHTVPDWDSIMALGFSGILKRAEECFEKIENKTQKQIAFFQGLKIEYSAIIRFIDRLYKYALTKEHDKAKKVAACLKNLRDGAPGDTFEALQIIYIYFMISEHIEHYQVRTLGYGLDSTLYSFFKKDIESGKYTKEEIGEFIGYFLMKFSAIGNYWGQPMFLGGMNVDGSTKVSELSYLILDVYNELAIYNPKIQLKINKSTPKDFILKGLDMIRRGVSSIVFVNGDAVTENLMSKGLSYEKAVEGIITGCYENTAKASAVGISGAYFSALKGVSLVLDNGYDEISGKHIGVKTGENFVTFDEFYKAYLVQLENMVNTYLGALNIMETKVQEVNPSLLFSATMPACVNKMTDALDGGLNNGSGILLSGLASAVDALMAVCTLVYDEKTVTLEEMKKAIDLNWEGYESLRAKAKNCKHKYGNGDKKADSYAAAIVHFVYNLIANRKNAHGCGYGMELHSARAFIIHGEKLKATPDGRYKGDETSKNASPAPGADKNGVTALINSATEIDVSLCTTGFCLDVMLHPTAVEGEEGLAAFYAVLDTYMKKGGESIHFNIFNPETLRDAQKNPEKYENLQVRVCGWNTLWNNMNKKEQDAYILRAENII